MKLTSHRSCQGFGRRVRGRGATAVMLIASSAVMAGLALVLVVAHSPSQSSQPPETGGTDLPGVVAESTLQAVAAYLGCEDLDCVQAREAIRRQGRSAVAPLCKVLEGRSDLALSVIPKPVLRRRAAAALGDLGGESAVRCLRPALGDPDPTVRAEAASALGRIDPATHAPILIDLLGDPDPLVRETVAGALGRSGRVDLLPNLRNAASRETEEHVRRALRLAVAALQTP